MTKTKLDDSPFFSRERPPELVPVESPVSVICADGIARKISKAYEFENGDYLLLCEVVKQAEPG
jgi:hypothetical protein